MEAEVTRKIENTLIVSTVSKKSYKTPLTIPKSKINTLARVKDAEYDSRAFEGEVKCVISAASRPWLLVCKANKMQISESITKLNWEISENAFPKNPQTKTAT